MRRSYAAWRVACIALAISPGCDGDAGPDAGPGSDADVGTDAAIGEDASTDAGRLDAGDRPTLATMSIDEYPAVDGSTSTLPLARLVACELFGLGYRWEPGRGSEGESEIVPVATTAEEAALAEAILGRIVFNRTHQAYLNLVDGTADLITVANPPSPDERAYADAHGVTLRWEPIGLDALVIVINEANPVTGLTTDQIQRIYAAEITNWRAVGGNDEDIHPYVRPENSGSQQLFETIVMQGHAMADWPEDRRPSYMGALIDNIRSDPQSIGYSVYYWVTYQYPSTGYVVLPVDGVPPTAATIGSHQYPFASEVWVVTRADLDGQSLAGQLHDWLLAPGGQGAVGRSGYVPVAP